MLTRSSVIAIAIVLCLAISPQGEEKRSTPYRDVPELQGGSYFPPQPYLLPETHRKNPGLADWDLLGNSPLKIQSVRLVGFTGYTRESRLDWTTKSPDVCDTIGKALAADRIFRPGVSDFIGQGTTGGLFGGNIGVIQLGIENKPLVIGVCKYGFYLGVWHGTFHQTFYSWLLAQEPDDLLREKTGKGLDREVFSRLSGESILDEQRQIYWKSHDRKD